MNFKKGRFTFFCFFSFGKKVENLTYLFLPLTYVDVDDDDDDDDDVDITHLVHSETKNVLMEAFVLFLS